MTVAVASGSRFPAYAASMGRVLLASLPLAETEAALADANPIALTPATVTALDALRTEVADMRERGWSIVD